MKIIIKESQVPNAMKIYVKKFFPGLSRGLKAVPHKIAKDDGAWKYLTIDQSYSWIDYVDDEGISWVKQEDIENNNWGSSSYQDDDDDDDEEEYEFTVNPDLEDMYRFFGRERFENYFKEVHGIDLKNTKKRKSDWVFD